MSYRRFFLIACLCLFALSSCKKKKGQEDATSQPVSGPTSIGSNDPNTPDGTEPTDPNPSPNKPDPAEEFPKTRARALARSKKLTEDGLAALQNLQMESAISFFEEALKKNPKNTEAATQLGELQRRRKKLDLAGLVYQTALLPSGNSLDFLRGYAQVLLEKGQGSQAIQLVVSEVEKDPDNADLLSLLSGVEVSAGKLIDAQEHARQALRLDEKHIGARISLGRAYLALNKDEIAISILRSAVDIDSNAGLAHFYRGIAEMRLEREDLAYISFQRAAELAPNFPEAQTNYASRLIALESYQSALSILVRATKLAPESAITAMNLGSAYRGIESFGQAELAYKKAISLDASLPEAHFNLAVLYLEHKVPSFGDNQVARLEETLKQFGLYKQKVKTKLSKNDPTNAYVELAEKQLEIARRRQKANQNDPSKNLQTPESSGPKGPGKP